MEPFSKLRSFSIVLKFLYLSAMIPPMLNPSPFGLGKVLLANFLNQ